MIKTIVRIDGMMCGMCENHINEAVRNNFKIKKVKASKRKKQAVILSEELLDQNQLKEVIENTGYHFISLETVE
ncbi:hypothetical protein lbkm_1037 [Lachnospiraceae bacterium KM106-2]|nr:hypothetical protein lbkm_1037 [Lachnospiraceae bacterium KM106-2]